MSAITGGFQITYRDGRVETFTQAFNDGGTDVYFITSSADPAGNSNTFNYSTVGGVMELSSLTDAVGQNTVFFYDNTNYPNLITRVVDPFSRTNYESYDTNGYLTNITDVAGLNSTIVYDFVDYAGVAATNLTTPYGPTRFRYDGYD